MSKLRLSPRAYRVLATAALVVLSLIILTGAAVRLTGSGMGCPNWPTCTGSQVYATGDTSQTIEATNRLVTGLAGIFTILVLVGVFLRRPYRRDLLWPAIGVVAGVLANGVIGGMVVLFHVQYSLVSLHFLASLAVVLFAVVLVHRAGLADDPAQRPPPPQLAVVVRRLTRAVLAAAVVVLVLGTVVTSSGPHAGDEDAQRLPLALVDVVRVHSIAAWILSGLAIALFLVARRSPNAEAVARRTAILLGVIALQIGIGYLQYFLRVPAVLVGAHVCGATLLWIATIHLQFAVPREATAPATSRPVAARVSTPAAS